MTYQITINPSILRSDMTSSLPLICCSSYDGLPALAHHVSPPGVFIAMGWSVSSDRCDWCCCACLHHWLKTVAWFCHVFQHDMCSFWFWCCFWCAKAHSTSNNHHEHPGEGRREGILHKFLQMLLRDSPNALWTGWQDLRKACIAQTQQHRSNLLPRWAQSTRVLTNDPYNCITKVLNCLDFCNMSQIQNHFCGKIRALFFHCKLGCGSNHQKYSNSMMECSANSYIQGVYTQTARTPAAPAISFESLGMWRPFCSEVENLWRMSSMSSLICLQTSSLAFQNCNFERIRKKKVNLSMRDFTLQQWMLQKGLREESKMPSDLSGARGQWVGFLQNKCITVTSAPFWRNWFVGMSRVWVLVITKWQLLETNTDVWCLSAYSTVLDLSVLTYKSLHNTNHWM